MVTGGGGISRAAGAAATWFFAADNTDAPAFRRISDLRIMGTVNAASAVIGGMLARGFARIVVVASTAGFKDYA